MYSGGCTARRLLAPELGHELLDRHDLIGADQQDGKHQLDLPRSDGISAVPSDHAERSHYLIPHDTAHLA
jgi:hypothetical protein